MNMSVVKNLAVKVAKSKLAQATVVAVGGIAVGSVTSNKKMGKRLVKIAKESNSKAVACLAAGTLVGAGALKGYEVIQQRMAAKAFDELDDEFDDDDDEE